MNVSLDVRGKEFIVAEDVLKKSQYFLRTFEWDKGINEMEIDNDPVEFAQFIDYLLGQTDNPGPLGDYYMVGQGKELIQENLIEWANEPLEIESKPNASIGALYLFAYMKYKPFQKSELIEKNFKSEDKEFKIEGNKITYRERITKSTDWIENFKFVTNRKIKNIKITYSQPTLKMSEIVIFDEENHDFMNENLSKVVPCYPYAFCDVHVIVEVELYNGTFDPWLQVIYDLAYATPEVKKHMARYGSEIDEPHYYLHEYGVIYSSCELRGDENLSGKMKMQVYSTSGQRVFVPCDEKYYHNKIKYRYMCKHYLGKINKISQMDLKPFSNFLLSKKSGPVRADFVCENIREPYCYFNRLNNLNDEYYHLNLNFNIFNTKGYIEFDKDVEVWEVGGKEVVFEY